MCRKSDCCWIWRDRSHVNVACCLLLANLSFHVYWILDFRVSRVAGKRGEGWCGEKVGAVMVSFIIGAFTKVFEYLINKSALCTIWWELLSQSFGNWLFRCGCLNYVWPDSRVDVSKSTPCVFNGFLRQICFQSNYFCCSGGWKATTLILYMEENTLYTLGIRKC